jgi:CAAX prenyl protease-like protein
MTFPPVEKPVIPSGEGQIAAGHRRRALAEVSLGYGVILVAIWTPLPWQRVVSWTALAWVLFATARSFDGWRTMGLGLSSSLRTLWMAGVALLLAAAAVVLAGTFHRLPVPGFVAMVVRRYWTYALWAFLQQFLLLDFILLRLLRLLPGKRGAVAGAAGLFALAHVPNPVLTPLTLLWGWVACALFLRYRNLYTLGAMHIIFGISIAIAVPGPVDHNMRVGLGYLTYRRPGHQHHHRISAQPEGPNGVDGGMGDGRRCDTALLTPRPAIEDSCDGRQQHIAPVEVQGALVPVG